MDIKTLLNLLRNPWGHDLQTLRKNRRAAADRIEALESSHAELLEALKDLTSGVIGGGGSGSYVDKARQAIKNAEEKQ